jgi:hypothetical protein
MGTTPKLFQALSPSGLLTSKPSISRSPIGKRIKPPAIRKESREIANKSSSACPHQQATQRVKRKVSTAMRLICLIRLGSPPPAFATTGKTPMGELIASKPTAVLIRAMAPTQSNLPIRFDQKNHKAQARFC